MFQGEVQFLTGGNRHNVSESEDLFKQVDLGAIPEPTV